jgi:streptogramin lyase
MYQGKLRNLGLAALVALAAGLPMSAMAAAGTISEYATPNQLTWGFSPGLDGNVWFVGGSDNSPGVVGRITPTGSVTLFHPPAGSYQFITVGPDGNIWFPEMPGTGKVARITYQGLITEFQAMPPGNSTLRGIVTGPDGNLWLTDTGNNVIVRMSTTGAVTTFGPLPTFTDASGKRHLAGAFGITAGPDGNLWFAERFLNKIGRITPQGIITQFGGLTAYPSSCGERLSDWPAGPTGITPGSDGNLWFNEVCNGKIGRITPQGAVTEYQLPHYASNCPTSTGTSCSHPWSITTGLDGNVWFTESDGWRVGRITPSGAITEFSLPPATGTCCSSGYPFDIGIAPAADGRFWFGTNANFIGAVTVS